jgi:hypothetical protein
VGVQTHAAVEVAYEQLVDQPAVREYLKEVWNFLHFQRLDLEDSACSREKE